MIPTLQTAQVGQLARVLAPDDYAVGIYIADGIDGPFQLEVDWIRAYADA